MMNAAEFSHALGKVNDRYIMEVVTCERRPSRKFSSPKRIAILIAAVTGLLALCGFAAYELGLFDSWLQKPSVDPIETVQSAIEGQAGKEYTIAVRVDEIIIDEEETARVRERYAGSELAESRGWSDEYLMEHFLVLRASYYVEYDHTKTFLDDGSMEQYFYLTQDIKTGEWIIAENDSPRTVTGEMG